MLPRLVDTLRRLSADRIGAASVDALEPQIDSAVRFAEALVALRKSTGTIPDNRVVRQNNRLINATRVAIRRAQAEEDRLLMERTAKATRRGARRRLLR